MLNIGTDIEDIERFFNLIEKSTFFNKVYTPDERAYILSKAQPAQTAAGIFCAKEAAVKALSTGILQIRLSNIEIRREKSGKPYIVLLNAAAEKYAGTAFSLSISHCKNYATATCIAINE